MVERFGCAAQIAGAAGLTGRINFDTLLNMEKEIIRTTEAQSAIASMSAEEKEEFLRLSLILHETGRLEYPYGEKVDGEENMFAMRIRKGGNFREFYAYDDGTCVWLLNGYEKKKEKDSDGGIEESQEDQKEIRIMNKKLSAKQMALREACIKESRGYFEKEWSRPDFAEGMKKFRQEYAMNVAMHQAKMESGLSQTAIAERMGIPRPNVSRIEHSRSVSFDTFCAYLKACGFAFSFALIPNS